MKRFTKPLSLSTIVLMSACSPTKPGDANNTAGPAEYMPTDLTGRWVSADNNSMPIIEILDGTTVVLNGNGVDRYVTTYERNADLISIKPEIFQGTLLFKVINGDILTGNSINGTWIKQN